MYASSERGLSRTTPAAFHRGPRRASVSANVNEVHRATFRAGRARLGNIPEVDENASDLSAGENSDRFRSTPPAAPPRSPPSSPTVPRGLRDPAMAERRRGVVFNLIYDGRTPSDSGPGLSTDRRLFTIAPAPRPHQHVRRASAPLPTTNENLHPRGPRPYRMSVARSAQELDGGMRFGAGVGGSYAERRARVFSTSLDRAVEGENRERMRERTEDFGTGAERSGGGKVKMVETDSGEIRSFELTDS